MAEVITQCDCGQLPPLPRNQQLDAYDRARWGAALSDAELDAMRAESVAAELEPIAEPCEGCGAEAGEECRPMCTGRAAYLDALEDARGPLGVLVSLADQWEAGDVDPDMVTAHVGAMVAEIRAMQGGES